MEVENRLGEAVGNRYLAEEDIRRALNLCKRTSVATSRKYLERNRPVALKVLRAYRGAIERIKADKAFTVKTLSKYMATQDNVVLDYSYNTALPLFRPLPYATPDRIVILSEDHPGGHAIIREPRLSNLTFEAWRQSARTV